MPKKPVDSIGPKKPEHEIEEGGLEDAQRNLGAKRLPDDEMVPEHANPRKIDSEPLPKEDGAEDFGDRDFQDDELDRFNEDQFGEDTSPEDNEDNNGQEGDQSEGNSDSEASGDYGEAGDQDQGAEAGGEGGPGGPKTGAASSGEAAAGAEGAAATEGAAAAAGAAEGGAVVAGEAGAAAGGSGGLLAGILGGGWIACVVIIIIILLLIAGLLIYTFLSGGAGGGGFTAGGPASKANCGAFTYAYPFQNIDSATYGKTHHNYSAIDMMAKDGEILLAITGGTIRSASHADKGKGGLSFTLIGDDGYYYYYAHLETLDSKIVAGYKITAGEKVGTNGHTGNATADAPHLHLGISKGEQIKGFYPSKVYDSPYPQESPWRTLDAWKAGLCPSYPGE